MPEASVTAVAADSVAPGPGAPGANVTVTPLTGRPPPPVTRTRSGAANGWLTVAVCAAPPTAEILPIPGRRLIESEALFVTATSLNPSPLKSATTAAHG